MAKVKTLVEGYARQIEDGWKASSTVSLVQSEGKNMIVDPGCNKEKLLEGLENEGLSTEDIDFVLLTHNHTDHSMLVGIFTEAKVIDTEEIYTGDRQVVHGNKIPEMELEIIQTPGHTTEHCSLVVPTEEGTCVVCGDVFWWMDGEEQRIDIEREDPAHSGDMEELIASRKKVLDIADYIVPGHGKTFKVKS